MRCSYLAALMFLFLSIPVFAQSLDSVVIYKVNKMRKSLNLTEVQASAISPVVKDYLIKREAILQRGSGQGIIDHRSVKGALKDLKKEYQQQLSQVLTEDQMKKWEHQEHLIQALNPDGASRMIDDSPTLSTNGPNFKF